MPANKSQHYVPKCYIRSFCEHEHKKTVNVFNLDRNKIIFRAPIKGQCARNYFYGKDLQLEKIMQIYEGAFSKIVEKIVVTNGFLEDHELGILREFAFLQYFRTDAAKKRAEAMPKEMQQFLIDSGEDKSSSLVSGLSGEDTIRITMDTFYKSRKLVSDLRCVILQNNTPISFVTSDDPAVFINKLYANKRPSFSSGGIESAGIILILPLSAKHSMICYDNDVYKLPISGKARTYTIDQEFEINKINSLQYLNASKNIFFKFEDDGEFTSSEYQKFKALRENERTIVSYAVEDDSFDSNSHKRYNSLPYQEAVKTKKNLLFHYYKKPILPPVWFSFLKYRVKPKYLDTKSGSGFKRLGRKEYHKYY